MSTLDEDATPPLGRRFPYRKFAVISDEIIVGSTIARAQEEPYSHADLFVQLAGPAWADRFEETACGWLIGEGGSFGVSIARYTAGGLPEEETRRAIERWAQEHHVQLDFHVPCVREAATFHPDERETS